MSQSIYEMLNGIETDFSTYQEEQPLSDLEKRRCKKSIMKKTGSRQGNKKKVIAAAACLAVCLTAIGMGPMKGEVEAAARFLSYNIQTALGVKKDLSGYENVVNQSVTKEGLTVTLNEVILDKDSLVVSITESGVLKESSPTGTLYINGRRMDGGASGGMRNPEGSEKIRESVMEYDLVDVDTDGTLDIELELSDIEGNSASVWEFSFTATGSQLSADTREIALDAGFELPDGSRVSLTSMTINDLGQKIYFNLAGRDKSYDLKLTGEDNLGNPVEFYLSRGTKEGGRLNLDKLSSSLSEEASGITLTPYAVEFPEKSGKLSDDWEQAGEAFTISIK